jgi:hypothetical protein
LLRGGFFVAFYILILLNSVANGAPIPMRTKFFLTLIGRITPLTIAFIFAFFAPTDKSKVLSYLCGIALLLAAEYFGIYRPLLNIEEARKRVLDLVFKDWLDSIRLGRRRPNLRVNVMLRRWWFGWRFYQYYQLNMDGDPDANLSFSVKRGFCGQVFGSHTQKARYRDFRQLSDEEQSREFKWTKSECRQTAHVKAIACAGLYRECRSFRGVLKHRYFGVLNVDATDDDGADFLDSDEALDDVTRLAKIAQVIFAD